MCQSTEELLPVCTREGGKEEGGVVVVEGLMFVGEWGWGEVGGENGDV